MNKKISYISLVMSVLIFVPTCAINRKASQVDGSTNFARKKQEMKNLVADMKNHAASRLVSSEVAKIINLRGKTRGIQPARRLKRLHVVIKRRGESFFIE